MRTSVPFPPGFSVQVTIVFSPSGAWSPDALQL